MTIGIILHPYGEKKPGGLPRIIFGWAEGLLSIDQKNEYVIFVKEKPANLPDLPGQNWRLEILGTSRFWLDRLGRASPCDVYLFNTPVLPFFFRPAKSVVIVLDYPYKYLKAESFRQYLFRKFISWYHGRSLHRANHIIAVSQSTKNDTVKFFGIAPEKINVVYHGYKEICRLPEQPPAITLPPKYFFFAGTIKERKNVFNIVKALELLIGRRPETIHKLVIGGKNEGAYYEMIRSYLHEHNLEERVFFLGHLNENQLSYVYKRAEALVFPSIVEGTGFPILEALSCGISVITSNIFGPAELGAGGAALLINPYDAEEISQAMEKIITNPALKEKMEQASVEQLKNFSWENCGRETLKILEKVYESR